MKMNRSLKKGGFVSLPDDPIIICRCEEISKGEIRKAIYDGMYTTNEIKRYLRAGMGLCQGQTCSRLIRGIIAKELDIDICEVDMPKPRSPVRPVKMSNYANDGIKEGDIKV